jgi:hypothetical protein
VLLCQTKHRRTPLRRQHLLSAAETHAAVSPTPPAAAIPSPAIPSDLLRTMLSPSPAALQAITVGPPSSLISLSKTEKRRDERKKEGEEEIAKKEERRKGVNSQTAKGQNRNFNKKRRKIRKEEKKERNGLGPNLFGHPRPKCSNCLLFTSPI